MALLYLLAGARGAGLDRRSSASRSRARDRPRDLARLAGRPGRGPRGAGRDRRPRRRPRGGRLARRRRGRRRSSAAASSSRPGSSTSTRTSASPATRTPRRSRPGSRRRPTAGSRRSARCRTRRRPSTSRPCSRGSGPRAAASGSPVELLAHGAVSAGRAGETLAALGELADAGVVGFSRRRVAGPLGADPAQRPGLRGCARAADRRPPRGRRR